MIHTAFLILVDPEQAADVNFTLKGYDLVILDDLLISPRIFSFLASTLKCLNNCPIFLVAGDKCQQHPLQTVGGKVHNTVSILSDGTFNGVNSIKHTLYQQFRVLDPDYGHFLDIVRYMQPTQAQLDKFQEAVVLCAACPLEDKEIFTASSHKHPS